MKKGSAGRNQEGKFPPVWNLFIFLKATRTHKTLSKYCFEDWPEGQQQNAGKTSEPLKGENCVINIDCAVCAGTRRDTQLLIR